MRRGEHEDLKAVLGHSCQVDSFQSMCTSWIARILQKALMLLAYSPSRFTGFRL